MTYLALWIVGLLMVFFELYLPGAILGTIGGFLLLGSIALFADEYGPLWTTLYFLLVLASVALIIKYALWSIKKNRSQDTFYSDDSQSGFYASSFDHSAIGKEGIVLSDLKPGGYILIDGKQQAAISESGYIVQGELVKVIGGDGDSLIVTKR